jgi:hypothetical protein
MTDGEDQDSGAVEAATAAAAAGITLWVSALQLENCSISKTLKAALIISATSRVMWSSHTSMNDFCRRSPVPPRCFYLLARGETMDALYEQGLAKLPKSEHQQKLVKRMRSVILACGTGNCAIGGGVPGSGTKTPGPTGFSVDRGFKSGTAGGFGDAACCC